MSVANITTILGSSGKTSTFESIFAYSQWKENVTNLLEKYPVPEKQTLLVLKLLVKGEAADKIAYAKITNVEQFWDTLDNPYGKRLNPLDDLWNLIHPPRNINTMKEYIKHFEEYLSYLPGNWFTDKGKIALFLPPLNQLIGITVRTQNPITLDDAIKYATISAPRSPFGILRLEPNKEPSDIADVYMGTESFSNDNTNEISKADVECYYCHKIGHRSNHCLQKKHDRKSNGQDARHYFNQRRNNRYNSKSKRSG